jgi:hypothetical protein
MSAITVPEQYAPGLARIGNLSSEEVDAVVRALERASQGTDSELYTLLRPVLGSLDIKALRELIGALRSLYSARTGMDIPVDEFISELIDAIQQRGDINIDQADSQRLKDTFRRLFSIHPLSMIAKAKDLLYDHENTFCDARVITDIRPVFDTDIKQVPTEAAITHTLKIEYHRGTKQTEIHIAVDVDDIDYLLSILWRAKEKSETLSGVLSKAGLVKLCE